LQVRRSRNRLMEPRWLESAVSAAYPGFRRFSWRACDSFEAHAGRGLVSVRRRQPTIEHPPFTLSLVAWFVYRQILEHRSIRRTGSGGWVSGGARRALIPGAPVGYQIGQHFPKLLKINGLHEVTVEVLAVGLDDIPWIGRDTEHDHHDGTPLRILLDGFKQLVSAHAGEVEIEQNQVGPGLAGMRRISA